MPTPAETINKSSDVLFTAYGCTCSNEEAQSPMDSCHSLPFKQLLTPFFYSSNTRHPQGHVTGHMLAMTRHIEASMIRVRNYHFSAEEMEEMKGKAGKDTGAAEKDIEDPKVL